MPVVGFADCFSVLSVQSFCKTIQRGNVLTVQNVLDSSLPFDVPAFCIAIRFACKICVQIRAQNVNGFVCSL